MKKDTFLLKYKGFIIPAVFILIFVLVVFAKTSGGKEKGTVDGSKRTVVENGDTIDLDYTGYIDGKTFDGGGTGGFGATLRIGSGEYIPGFEEGCIGHEIGETFDLTVTFPDNYGNASLAGKEAVFTITINDILGDDL